MPCKKTAARACLFAAATFAIVTAPAAAADPVPLDRAHAHNDYLHERPLADALDHGFCSIEADVWVSGDELLIGHTLAELRPGRTLTSLYLEPLAKRCADRDGWVCDSARTVTLLIDFKTDGAATYPVLAATLARFKQLFEPRIKGPGQPPRPPVLAIISGNRPIEMIAGDKDRLCSVDGRLPDLEGEQPADLIPLVSDAWSSQFRWQGEGPMPPEQRRKLRDYAAAAHAQGRRLRFWGAPDAESVWAELYDAGVDLLGADDLPRLQRFLAARMKVPYKAP
jgi:hypothetical protein